MRYFFLLPAIVLDVIQFFVGWAFIAMQFATPVGGAAVGGLSGLGLCWKFIDGFWKFVASAPACVTGGGLIGAGMSAFAIPIGIAVDVALSITIGGAIIIGLAFSGMFYPRIIISRLLGELAPFFNFLPIWSNMVWKCIQEKKKQEAGLSTGRSTMFIGNANPAKALLGASVRAAERRFAPAVAMQKDTKAKGQEKSRAPLLPNRFNDIRPAVKGATLALLLVLGTHAHAQTVPPVQYVVASETPGAHEMVVIEVQGVGSFLGSADITWSRDGKIAKEGIGERTYSFTTGALGERTVVRVTIDSSQGFFTQTFNFNPSRINLVWEADTTVPPLYRGKALYSAGSNYKVVALPTVYSPSTSLGTGGSRVSASALSYQWEYRGDPVPEASGLGRNVFAHSGDQLQPSEDIAVDVYYGVNKVGRAELAIPVTPPFIVLYQRDALRGVLYDTALPAAISLVGKEITVEAQPYYFSVATKKSGLIPFVWTLNDTETVGPDSVRGILTLRQTGSGQGNATIGVSMQNNNPDQLIQSAQTSLQLVFGAQQSNALFNFIGL